jgi:pimeloyl-ACP methyl ester carboxylesterase
MDHFRGTMTDVAYDSRGEGDPIVFLHAGGHDHHDFDELRALLPARFRTIAADWPAHGASPPIDPPPSAMQLADLTEEFVAAVAPGGAVVVGNSVGGFATVRLALRRPDLVKGVVLISPGGFVGRPPHVRAFCSLMGKPWFMRRIYPAFATRYTRPRTDADRRARDASVATTRRESGLRALGALWRSFASPDHDLRGDVARIDVPTLLLWGRRDPVIPLRVGRRLEKAIRGSRLVVFEAGHTPQTTDPAGVAAELVPFAEQVFDQAKTRSEVVA